MREPFAAIITASGANLIERFKDRLVALRIYDEAGGTSDRLEFDIVVDLPFPKGPEKGLKYKAYIGWSESGSAIGGTYTVQNHSISGDAGGGYIMTVTARASDFLDKMKRVDSKIFNDKTVGEIVNETMKPLDIEAVISPELVDIKIPYRLRYNQSVVGFLASLAGDIGATMKPAGGKLVIQERGSGKSASGKQLPIIEISADDHIEVEFAIDVRGKYKGAKGDSFDGKKGKFRLKTDDEVYAPLYPGPTKEEAERMARARLNEATRRTVSGSFVVEGHESAIAEAKIKTIGFGPDIDEADLIASSVVHEVNFGDSGWTTRIEASNKKPKPGEKKKKFRLKTDDEVYAPLFPIKPKEKPAS